MFTALKQNAYFTYADYARWPEEERRELIQGTAYAMTAPLRIHQEVVGDLRSRQTG